MKRRDNRIPRLCSAGADRNAIDSRRLRENVGGGRDEQEEYPPGEHSRTMKDSVAPSRGTSDEVTRRRAHFRTRFAQVHFEIDYFGARQIKSPKGWTA